ncbi:DUF4348 domain-containing protein [Flavobacterium sp. FlaQc-57]|uniref:DUF4348 domain-containing protein n=1 Tax=Flavobacterium sp. FlaQc-57 TaxID=3374186 RepID=UPI003756957E
MNPKPAISLLLLSFLFVNCKNESIKPDNKRLEKPKVENIKIKKPASKIADENFEDFLKDFSRDSLFQISRVKFPLKVKEIDLESMEEIKENKSGFKERTISKSEYTKLDFTYPKDALTRELDRYSQKNILKNNLMNVEIRGIDNGIYSDFYFEKINGKWFLKSWKEQST